MKQVILLVLGIAAESLGFIKYNVSCADYCVLDWVPDLVDIC